MIDINQFRHPKEKLYFTLAAALGVVVWLGVTLGTMGAALLFILVAAIPLWMTQQFFKAEIYGNAVRVSERQYPDLHKMITQCARELGLEKVPEVFVTSGGGALNAFAIKFIGNQYVVLYAELVDMLLRQRQIPELRMIIAHELGHHAAGHTDWKKGLLLMPTMWLPYLGPAYSRACEFTADRLGAAVTGDLDASKRALVALAAGTSTLKTDVAAFVRQESEIPKFFGYINEVYASHPRTTRRVSELDAIKGQIKRRATAPLPLAQREGRVPAAEQVAQEEYVDG